jgi:hypothetical protein
MPLNLIHHYYTEVSPNPRVLELCGVAGPGTPYTTSRDDDLTVIINGFARPEYLPLIWEAIQYQTRRPRETWLVQNDPGGRAAVPRDFFASARRHSTVVIDSGLNHGCWFRFLLAALYCRTRYVAIFDDDTLPGRQALAAAVEALAQRPGIYGGRGITFRNDGQGPRFWSHDVFGWPVGTPEITQVDFVGHMWVTETAWLRHLVRHLPDRLFDAAEPGRECGEDMFLSFVAQRRGLPTFVYAHGPACNARWSSIQAYEMGFHPHAMNLSGGLSGGEHYLREAVSQGWRLLRFA